jgi:hypothetical protein
MERLAALRKGIAVDASLSWFKAMFDDPNLVARAGLASS